MKKGLLVLILFTTYFCKAQNYQCIQNGVKHYFINGNGYLRGVWSISDTSGDTIFHYLPPTPRGAYDPGLPLDPSTLPYGGSWLGRKVLQLNDGTFIFDSYWNDSVILKTHANIGESWVFFHDSSSLYYRATVISTDTLTVLSSVDSVKTIMINAYNDSGIVTSDPLDSFNIILSKNNGFVQVFDLYTFPYHKPDSIFRQGLDFFLDRSTCNYSEITGAYCYNPNANITIFKLVNFINPNQQQLHNWNIGDIIETYHSFDAGAPISLPCESSDNILDTVIDKVISGNAISYTISGKHFSCRCSNDPCDLILNKGECTFYNTAYLITDTSFLPESDPYASYYVFYFPNDSSNCLLSPEYVMIPFEYHEEEENPVPTIYKFGIGLTYYGHIDVDNLIWEFDGLVYTNINGIPCGTPPDSSSQVSSINLSSHSFLVFPNPASSELTITAIDRINQINITNLLGQSLYIGNYNNKQAQIDVSDLPAGIYFIRINGTEVRKFVKE